MSVKLNLAEYLNQYTGSVLQIAAEYFFVAPICTRGGASRDKYKFRIELIKSVNIQTVDELT